MSNILSNIVDKRRTTVRSLKEILPVEMWESMPLFKKKCISMKRVLSNGYGTGIIAEFKRASPSKGVINGSADVFDVVRDYEMNGASAVSILTEPFFFNGSNDDILRVAEFLTIPILRKDFIIDEYQLFEAKALGADVVLLIASVLTKQETRQLARMAQRLGMEVLLEVHSEAELEWINDDVDLVGVNNRDLKTFSVDINTSLQLSERIPAGKIKISESGISDVSAIHKLKAGGFDGFLIGENFMKENNPGQALDNFVQQLKQ